MILSIVSLAGVVLGRNDFIAWGITNVATDVQDLFQLEVIDSCKNIMLKLR